MTNGSLPAARPAANDDEAPGPWSPSTTPSRSGDNGHQQRHAAPENEGDATGPPERAAGRNHLFRKDKQRERGDPEDVHHAADEQQRHHGPAAAEAKHPTPQPHTEGAECSSPANSGSGTRAVIGIAAGKLV